MLRSAFVGEETKLAVTVIGRDMMSWHAPAPEQSPAQPEKVDPARGVGVRLTKDPWFRLMLHEAWQSADAGVPAMPTLPCPTTLIERILGLSRFEQSPRSATSTEMKPQETPSTKARSARLREGQALESEVTQTLFDECTPCHGSMRSQKRYN